jgi:hypothetical protein
MAGIEPNVPINIVVDQDALKKQIEGVAQEALRGAAAKLRKAALALDPEFEERVYQAGFDRGVEQGRAILQSEIDARNVPGAS